MCRSCSPDGGSPIWFSTGQLALRLAPIRARAAAGFDYFAIGVPGKAALDAPAAEPLLILAMDRASFGRSLFGARDDRPDPGQQASGT